MINEKIDRIYIYCIANIKSGGPELLHQLSYHLCQCGKESYIVYYNHQNGKSDTHQEFLKYLPVVKQEHEIIDDENSLIIVPESSVKHLNAFSKALKAIWWLSVDNFTNWATVKGRAKTFGLLHSLSNPKLLVETYRIVKNADYHFCQSFYSKEYLLGKKIEKGKIFMLSDYISDNYFEVYENKNNTRIKQVAYFPRKGMEITKELLREGRDIKWIPIQNMTSEQVHSLLLESMVYIDFGHFPGKDRIPREAVISGCCIITGKRGAAYYNEDVPILEEYKYADPLNSIEDILNKIRECLSDYEMKTADFENYRDIIRKEKSVFLSQIRELFLV